MGFSWSGCVSRLSLLTGDRPAHGSAAPSTGSGTTALPLRHAAPDQRAADSESASPGFRDQPDSRSCLPMEVSTGGNRTAGDMNAPMSVAFLGSMNRDGGCTFSWPAAAMSDRWHYRTQGLFRTVSRTGRNDRFFRNIRWGRMFPGNGGLPPVPRGENQCEGFSRIIVEEFSRRSSGGTVTVMRDR